MHLRDKEYPDTTFLQETKPNKEFHPLKEGTCRKHKAKDQEYGILKIILVSILTIILLNLPITEIKWTLKITEKHFHFSHQVDSWQPEGWVGTKGCLGFWSIEKTVVDNSSIDVEWTRVDSGISPKNTEVKRLTEIKMNFGRTWLDNVADHISQIHHCNISHPIDSPHNVTLTLFPWRGGSSTALFLEPSWAGLCDSLHQQSIIEALQLSSLDHEDALLSWYPLLRPACHHATWNSKLVRGQTTCRSRMYYRCSVWHPR